MKNIPLPLSLLGKTKFLSVTLFLLTLFSFEKALAQNCSITSFDYTYTNQTLSSDLVLSSKNIKIIGTVTLNCNVGLNYCKIRMEPGAQIIITGSHFLQSYQCDFFGCNGMWNSIVVQSNATIYCLASTFQNAAVAIDFKAGFSQNSAIAGCTFQNNRIGINVGKKLTTTQFHPALFGANTFTSDGGFLLSPYNTQHAYCGIQFASCSSGLVGYAGNNTYSNMHLGIIASNNSTIWIKGETFSDMFSDNSGFFVYGNAIYAASCNLKVEDCFFSNDKANGIMSSYTRSLEVRNCSFDNEGDFGVFTDHNNQFSGSSLLVEKNVFNLNLAKNDITELGAISFERTPSTGNASTKNKIYDNQIYVSGEKTRDMSLIDVTAPAGGNDFFDITNNFILVLTNSTPIHGIYITGNSNQINVSNNQLYYLFPDKPPTITSTLGIAAVSINGVHNKINNNRVEAVLFADQWPEEQGSLVKCGIHIDSSPDFQICGDTVDQTYRGVHFSGDLEYCDFAKNIIMNHYYGIHCRHQDGSPNTTMGDQNWHENQWTGTYENWGALYDGIDGNPGFLFRVTTASPFGATYLPSSSDPSGWFVNAALGEDNSDCVGGLKPPRSLSELDQSVIEKVYEFASPTEEWDTKRELMLKLMRYPELMPEFSDAETFYNATINTSEGKFATAEKLYYEAFTIPAPIETAITAYQEKLKTLMDSLGHLSILQIADTTSIDTIITNKEHAVSLEIEDVINSLALLYDDAWDLQKGALNDVDDWNGDLPSTETYESNLKTLYTLIVRKTLGDSLTEANYDDMRDIAVQCPAEGGRSIRLAPYLLPPAEAIVYHREEIWESCAEDRSDNRAAALPAEIKIIPNPAQDVITVWLPEKFNSGVWSLTALDGTILQNGSTPLDARAFRVNLKALSPGVYLFTAKSLAGGQFTEKVVVSR